MKTKGSIIFSAFSYFSLSTSKPAKEKNKTKHGATFTINWERAGDTEVMIKEREKNTKQLDNNRHIMDFNQEPRLEMTIGWKGPWCGVVWGRETRRKKRFTQKKKKKNNSCSLFIFIAADHIIFIFTDGNNYTVVR